MLWCVSVQEVAYHSSSIFFPGRTQLSLLGTSLHRQSSHVTMSTLIHLLKQPCPRHQAHTLFISSALPCVISIKPHLLAHIKCSSLDGWVSVLPPPPQVTFDGELISHSVALGVCFLWTWLFLLLFFLPSLGLLVLFLGSNFYRAEDCLWQILREIEKLFPES